MTLNRIDKILHTLFPKPDGSSYGVWAVLDGARDERIFPFLRDCGLEYICLYSGNLPRELRWVAPYMVELPPGNSITRNLINMAWGNSWGIFLTIKDSSNLRHHLRKFLRVQDESGKMLIFRYYDPRVLRVFLPTCTNEQLKTMFGPIESYWVEGENGEGMLEYRFGGISLAHRLVMLNGK